MTGLQMRSRIDEDRVVRFDLRCWGGHRPGFAYLQGEADRTPHDAIEIEKSTKCHVWLRGFNGGKPVMEVEIDGRRVRLSARHLAFASHSILGRVNITGKRLVNICGNAACVNPYHAEVASSREVVKPRLTSRLKSNALRRCL